MRDRIKEYLCEQNDAIERYSGDDLIEDGLLDSLELMAFITRIEEEFGIEFSPEEIIIENFKTIDVICELVEKKRLY